MAATATRLILKEWIPADAALLDIPLDSLMSLPPGASYRRKDGRAEVEATRKGNTLRVAATCDSVAREAERFEQLWWAATEELEQLRRDSRTERQTPAQPFKALLAAFAAGLIAGATAVLLLVNKFK